MSNSDRTEPADFIGVAEEENALLVLPPPESPPGTPPPLVVPREEHTISRRDICPYALKVLYRLIHAGHVAYLVGGGVRDLLLGRAPKDFDISTDATPNQIKRLFRNCWLIGRRFRLAHIKFGETVIETSTFRSLPVPGEENGNGNGNGEGKEEGDAPGAEADADLYVRSDNTFGTPREDAFRRDFTINGLFYDATSYSVIDFVGGLEDLRARRIRAIGDPGIRFREDPVRMLRAVRFASRLSFEIDPVTYEAIRAHRDEIEKASPSRLMEEVARLFGYGAGAAALRLLRETSLLPHLLPTVAAYLDAADTEQRERYWAYLARVDERTLARGEVDAGFAFAALLLPLWLAGRGDGPHLREHIQQARHLADSLADALNFPRRLRETVTLLLAAQSRLLGIRGRRFRKHRFLALPHLSDALALFQAMTEIEAMPREPLEEWTALYEEFLEKHPRPVPAADGAEDSSSSRRRRRRPRRRSKAKRSSGASSSAATPAEAETEADSAPPEPKTPAAAEAAAAAPAGGKTPEDTKSKRRRSRRKKKKPAGDSTAAAPASSSIAKPAPAAEPPAKEKARPAPPASKPKPTAEEDDAPPPHWLDEI